jgi:hypothetical protein
MTGSLWLIMGCLGGLLIAAVGDMVSEEVRDRLGHLPHAILRLAARRLDVAENIAVYEEEWLPELVHILKGDDARPVTRLIHGTRYAIGIFVSSRRIMRELRGAQVPVSGLNPAELDRVIATELAANTTRIIDLLREAVSVVQERRDQKGASTEDLIAFLRRTFQLEAALEVLGEYQKSKIRQQELLWSFCPELKPPHEDGRTEPRGETA